MSTVSPAAYQVLLPAARVGVFSPHAETRATFAALSSDWRFSRVKIEIEEGDVEAAAAYYRSHPSPDLLIVDTDEIGDGFTGRLEQLGHVCAEGTNAAVIGPVNDVYLYRNLMALGISDYLVRPVKTEVVGDLIARVLLEQMGASDSQLIAVIGAKGGTGASTIAGLLSSGLAQGGHKTVLMDLSGGRSYLCVSFAMEPFTTLTEVSRAASSSDEAALSRTLQKAGENLLLLGTGNDRYLDDPLSVEAAERVLDRLLAIHPYVVVDLSQAPLALSRVVLSRARRVFVATLPTLSSLRLARTLVQEIQDLRGGAFEGLSLIVNMVGIAPGAEVAVADIEKALGQKVSASLPFDPKLVIGAEAQACVLSKARGADRFLSSLAGTLGLSGTSAAHEKTKKGLLGSLIKKGK